MTNWYKVLRRRIGSFETRGEFWKTRIFDSSHRFATFGTTGVEDV